MKLTYHYVLLFLCLISCVTSTKPVEHPTEDKLQKKTATKLIFDTDIAPDYDDVGAVALLHAFANNGEIEILATISSNAFYTTAPTISVLNTYFGRPDIPIGITKNELPNKECSQKWAEALIAKYPHNVKSNNEAIDAIKLYRKILSQAADSSVTIVTVGFFTNMANLLTSEPDEFSSLSGKDLIAKKVKVVISMATVLVDGNPGWAEFNVAIDTKASQIFFSQWNTPVILSPFEVGEKILTGIRLINDTTIKNSPVKEAYQIALAYDKNNAGRMSWDQTAVLIAARGYTNFFNSRMLNFKIADDGKNVLIPGERFTYLSFKQTPAEIQKVIEDLMLYQPKSNN